MLTREQMQEAYAALRDRRAKLAYLMEDQASSGYSLAEMQELTASYQCVSDALDTLCTHLYGGW